MPISKERLLKLALKRLQNERAQIESEIEEIEGQLNAETKPAGQERAKKKQARRKMSAQQRKAASDRMKKYWAKKKKQQKKG